MTVTLPQALTRTLRSSTGTPASTLTARTTTASAAPSLAFGINPAITRFSKTNALGTAKLSDLIYEPKAKVLSNLQAMGATEAKFFDANGTQAVIAATDDRVVVAFRGSESGNSGDWFTDFDFIKTRRFDAEVHRGFSKALDEVWPTMAQTIQELQSAKRRPVVLTGHSMGGALATLAAVELSKMGIKPSQVYTFGSPPVGDAAFARLYKSTGIATYRMVNGADAVPRLEAPGYDHIGEERFLDGGTEARTNTGYWGKLWERATARIVAPFNAGITAHRMPQYFTNLNALADR